MNTDKLQATSNTVAEILSEPPSPPTFFDEEPYDAARASEQVVKASDNLQESADIPKENLGKPTSRKFGTSPNAPPEAQFARDAENESSGSARQAVAEQTHIGSSQQFSRLSDEAASPRSDPRTATIDAYREAVPSNRISPGGWAVRGLAGILLAAGIGVGGVTWLGSPRDAARTAPSQPAPLVQAAPAAAASPELTPLLQSMARDLASMGKEIEQLKAGRDQMVRDNANLSEQFKASQEQLTRTAARLSEQLKASQEQAARDNANMAEQVRGIQEQLTSVIARASEPNARPRIATAPPRPSLASPRPAVPAERKPAPIVSTAQPAVQPRAEKPKPPSTSRPPAPAR